MKIEKLRDEIKKLQDRRKELFKLRKPIDKEISSGFKRIEALENQRDKLLAKEKSEEWIWLLDRTENSTAKFEALDKKLKDSGLMRSGFNKETKQTALAIQLVKNNEDQLFDVFISVANVLPFIKKSRNGHKHFELFDHRLSKNGKSYSLAVSDKKCHVITHSPYSQDDHLESFQDLISALRYCQENHWYKE